VILDEYIYDGIMNIFDFGQLENSVKMNDLDRFVELMEAIEDNDNHGQIDKINKKRLLNMAISSKSYNIMKYLVDRFIGVNVDMDIDINDRFLNGLTPLLFAVNQKDPDMVKYLVKKGANVHAYDMNANTSLHYAVSYLDIDIVTILLDNGSCIDSINRLHNTPLHIACSLFRNTNYFETIKLLLEYGASIDIVNLDGNTPVDILKNGADGSDDIVKYIMEYEFVPTKGVY